MNLLRKCWLVCLNENELEINFHLTCKSVGVNDLSAPPNVPKGVLLAATTNTDLEREWPTADMLLADG